MNQVPTPASTTVNAAANHGAPAASIHTQLAPTDTHITAIDAIFARRGITTPGCRYFKNGPNSGTRTSRASSQGQLRAKHQHATTKNTVVGIPGTNAPIAPSPTHATPTLARGQRTALDV